MQGYQLPELWDEQALRHLAASGHSMPAGWSLQDPSLALPGPAATILAGSSSSSAGSRASDCDSANGKLQLWVHQPEGSYRWEQVAECPVYVR